MGVRHSLPRISSYNESKAQHSPSNHQLSFRKVKHTRILFLKSVRSILLRCLTSNLAPRSDSASFLGLPVFFRVAGGCSRTQIQCVLVVLVPHVGGSILSITVDYSGGMGGYARRIFRISKPNLLTEAVRRIRCRSVALMFGQRCIQYVERARSKTAAK